MPELMDVLYILLINIPEGMGPQQPYLRGIAQTAGEARHHLAPQDRRQEGGLRQLRWSQGLVGGGGAGAGPCGPSRSGESKREKRPSQAWGGA